jgi:extracellular factor (EF) 3-hydroxypalmitic acid methyl ester biosynthesis protein
VVAGGTQVAVEGIMDRRPPAWGRAALARAQELALELHEILVTAQRELAAEPDFERVRGEWGTAIVAAVLGRYAELTRLDDELDPAQRAGAVAHHRALVQPLFLNVPVIRRSVERPFGYPGDYLMVEALFGEGPEPDSPFAALLERVVLQCAPSRAHRYRAPWAQVWLGQHARAHGEPLRVLSFACGPERILRAHAERGACFDATLCDHDSRALAHAQPALTAALAGRGAVQCVELSAVGLIRGGSALRAKLGGAFDAVLVLGLLDYLSDPLVRRLARALGALLRSGGLLLASNLDRRNPHRCLMEYVGDWYVLHRDRAEFERLMQTVPGLDPVDLSTDPEATNLLFVGRGRT